MPPKLIKCSKTTSYIFQHPERSDIKFDYRIVHTHDGNVYFYLLDISNHDILVLRAQRTRLGKAELVHSHFRDNQYEGFHFDLNHSGTLGFLQYHSQVISFDDF